MPKKILHIEGLAVFVICLYFYQLLGFNWLLFIILLFSPDIAALGYLYNAKIGSLLYNIVHTYTFPILFLILGVMLQANTFLALGLIFSAHIGLDRLCGFGLKYSTYFKDTHFTRI